MCEKNSLTKLLPATHMVRFFIAAILFGTTLIGQTIALNFSSLPSAQGWTYNYVTGCPGPESATFSVVNNMLHQNTIGCGIWGADYELYNIVPNAPYSITVRARLTSDEVVCDNPKFHFGLGFGSQGNGKAYYIGLGPQNISAIIEQQFTVLSTSVDTTQFHNYVLSVTPVDGRFTLSVDGTLIGSGVGFDLTNSNLLFLGDSTSCWNAAGDYSSFAFHTGNDTVGPITSSVTVSPNPVAVNANATVGATISDTTTGGSNIASAYYIINGSTPAQMVLAPTSAVTVTASATLPPFSLANLYNVCVKGTDSAGNTGANTCISLPVYDPSGKSIEGEGRVAIPVSSYNSKAASAEFEIEASYERGRNTPSGSLQFELGDDNLKFASTSLNWLALAKSPSHAILHGTGKLNGKHVCTFEADLSFKSFQPGNNDALGLKIFACSGGAADFTLAPTPLTKGRNKIDD
jgi:hypothetical protein